MIADLEIKSLSTDQETLIWGLGLIPEEWALTPLLGNKAPYRKGWQNETPSTHPQIIADIWSGQAKGYGIRTGRASNGIASIDFDGSSAMQKALELSGGEALPDTVSFTSNRIGREQRLYLVPEEYWDAIETKKIKTGVIGDDGKPEQLELRWDGCQSVLPPSVHPTTGFYRWRRSPQEVEIAPAPMWVIKQMLIDKAPQEPQLPLLESQRPVTSYTRKARSGEEWSDEEWALSYLSALSPYRADDYDDWLKVGMVLHFVSDCLLSEWDNWSRQSSKYQPGCCEKKWKSFNSQGVTLGTLGKMAQEDGWRSPFERNDQKPLPSNQKSVSSKSNLPELSTVERFKADLLALANSDDDLERLVRINELASTYRMPAAEIRKALNKIETATRTPKAQFFKLDEFLSMESEGINYLIPGLLPRGETVLCAGLPKSGKTLLAIDAGFAIATGESHFLGEAVQKGRVLLISVDESAQSTKAKLLKRGFRPQDAENIAVMTAWDISQLDALETKLEVFRPDLVIIDSLKRITAGHEISENSAEFADVLYTLKELIGRYGAASILIHHSNKNQEATGVSRVRGSTAIAGAVWGIWQMDIPESEDDSDGKPNKAKSKQKRFDPTNPNRIFTAICRDSEGALLNIKFNPENHSYSISEGDESAQSERKTQEQKILEILAQVTPKGLTGREVLERSGLGRGVYSVLNRMVDKRLITQRQSISDARMTVYCLPKQQGTHTPPLSVEVCDQYSSKAFVGNDLEIDHKLITNPGELITNFCKNDQKQGCDQSPNTDTAVHTVVIDHKNLTEGGCVCVDESVTKVKDEFIAKTLCSDEPAPWFDKYEVEEDSEVVCEGSDLAIAPAPAPAPAELAQPELPIDQRSDGGFQVTEADLWRDKETIQDIVGHLQRCSDREALAELRKIWTSKAAKEAMNLACKQLSSEKYAQIKQWVVELNAGEPC